MYYFILLGVISLSIILIFFKIIFSNYNKKYDKVISLTKKALELRKYKEYAKAIDILLKASKILPTYPYTFYDIGYCYYLLKDMDNAKKYLIKSI